MSLLAGKTTLVTGGGNGIGRATALAMAREGARVVVADIESDTAEATVAAINEAGGQAIAKIGDLTRAAEVEALIATVLSAYGRLDCAFNNAGIAPYQLGMQGRKTAEWEEPAFDRMIEINLKSVWLCMKHELPAMQAAGGGSIVNTASIAGLVGLRVSSAYVAAKHAVIGLTKAAALEYGAENIRINAVCPGYVETRMTVTSRGIFGDHLVNSTPLGLLGKSDEIAELVVWLCSD
ncbi:MAG: SDR family oxidoreductase, partial [Pseudomonadota bacterium]|nr:SDR family oxidoreductase [Pseudomonadota bacterium]